MNVLIYKSNDTCSASCQQLYLELKSILGHAYDIMQVDTATLQNEPWQDTCAMMVVPEGQNSDAAIVSYVHGGGRYLGFDDELYPGSCQDPGFEKGSVSVQHNNATYKAYYSGGKAFLQTDTLPHVKAVCHFDDTTTTTAAVVHCQVEKGSALLLGCHPDVSLLRLLLAVIGMDVEQTSQQDVPDVSPLYLSTVSKELLEAITQKLLGEADENSVFKDSNNSFHIAALDDEVTELLKDLSVVDSKDSVLKIRYPSATSSTTIDASITPHFNLQKYFECLMERRSQEWGGGAWYRFGNAALYADVITSTQTVLDKNYNFAQCLPNGLVCVATNQIAGRGRGRNSWVSQSDALQFSFIVRHSLQLTQAPVVFIQYIIALSIVESIRTRKGYEDVPLRVKWPNDVYVEVDGGELKKVGGLLVNSSFVQNEFLLVIGCGVNLNNRHPTVSINDVIAQHGLKRLAKEDVLAHILVTFEKFYMEFCEKGMGTWFLNKYYERWLHSDKLVTLTTHNDEKARIVGITRDYGLLEAVSVNDPRKRFTLQPDGNSFDMLKGLIIKKT